MHSENIKTYVTFLITEGFWKVECKNIDFFFFFNALDILNNFTHCSEVEEIILYNFIPEAM